MDTHVCTWLGGEFWGEWILVCVRGWEGSFGENGGSRVYVAGRGVSGRMDARVCTAELLC